MEMFSFNINAGKSSGSTSMVVTGPLSKEKNDWALASSMEDRISGSRVDRASRPEEILGTRLLPGNNLTLSLPKGMITVSLDHLGDWTITVGLGTSEGAKILRLVEQLGELGFFHAAESGGVDYFLWTSAFEDTQNPKGRTEQVLFQTLNTMQGSDQRPLNRYIS